jgi:Fe-S-cluster containining protein
LKSALDLSPYLSDYHRLLTGVDQLLGRIRRKYGGHIVCHRGCACGCRNLSVFPIEALSLVDALWKLPEATGAKFQRRAASASFWECALLEDGACQMYAFRPILCRTHGFPLQTIYNGRPSIGYCRKNFKEMSLIPEDAIVDLDSINRMLRRINAAAVDRLSQTLMLPERLSIAEAIQLAFC